MMPVCISGVNYVSRPCFADLESGTDPEVLAERRVTVAIAVQYCRDCLAVPGSFATP